MRNVKNAKKSPEKRRNEDKHKQCKMLKVSQD